MPPKRFRVIQWATGIVGKDAIRHFANNPQFDLVGTWVNDPEKVGKDAGVIAGIPPLGVIATNDINQLISLEADCVYFAPFKQDIALVCRLLRSGKNVVSPLGPYYRTEQFRSDWEAIEQACKDGEATFHGSGIHPGFVGDLLPLTLARVMERIDHIHVDEIVDFQANPSNWITYMGFGRPCDELLSNPSRPPEAVHFFAQSMALVIESLGHSVDDLTTKLEVSGATRDITYPGGIVKKGTVAGQHYEWTAWSGGIPRMTFHTYWIMGHDSLETDWNCGSNGYRIRFEGNPALQVTLSPGAPGSPEGGGGKAPWTAMAGLNAIAAICTLPPGFVSHLDLGVVCPPGLMRK